MNREPQHDANRRTVSTDDQQLEAQQVRPQQLEATRNHATVSTDLSSANGTPSRALVEELRAGLARALSFEVYTAWDWEREHQAIFGRFVGWVRALPDTDERFDVLCRSADLNMPLIMSNYLTCGRWANDFGISVMNRVWPGDQCSGVPEDEERLFDRLLQVLLLDALAYEVIASRERESSDPR